MSLLNVPMQVPQQGNAWTDNETKALVEFVLIICHVLRTTGCGSTPCTASLVRNGASYIMDHFGLQYHHLKQEAPPPWMQNVFVIIIQHIDLSSIQALVNIPAPSELVHHTLTFYIVYEKLFLMKQPRAIPTHGGR